MNMLTKAVVQGAACGLMIGLVLLVGGRVWHPVPVAAQAPVVPNVVRARSFEVVDTAGKTRAILGLSILDRSPTLGLYDAAGKLRADLSTSDDSPRLTLSDAATKARASLEVSFSGRAALDMVDSAGKLRANLDLGPGGSPNLMLREAGGLVLFDKDGKTMWQAP